VRQAIRIGTAGWTIPRSVSDRLAGEGGHLARYARRLNAAEINSSFHRPHRPATYARWAECVPAAFRFSVKLPRAITHERRLVDCEEPFAAFLAEVAPLGGRLGPLLIQLPPSLAFDAEVADAFFSSVRERFAGPIACEPRHASWFDGQAEALLKAHEIARAAADPARADGADAPGGWPGLVYMRLHGSPRIYFSAYEPAYVRKLARSIGRYAESGSAVWCIFDNTGHGAALPNALALIDLMSA
jgi:uncharacterized protein YecE (DUF72 family)